MFSLDPSSATLLWENSIIKITNPVNNKSLQLKVTKNVKYPPEETQCPDYWKNKGDGKCLAGNENLGTCGFEPEKTILDFSQFLSSEQGKKALCKMAKSCGVVFDGITNVIDIVSMVNGILGAGFTSEESAAADMNSDGIINVVDIVSLVNLILG